MLLTAALLLSLVACGGAEMNGMDLFGDMNLGVPEYVYGVDDGSNAAADKEEEMLPEGNDEIARDAPEGEKFIENEFINTADSNISTLSADVDTASYTYFRTLVNQGACGAI
jgi:Ca-activated chloride channel family protein